MIQSIQLKSFKAFSSRFLLNLSNQSQLLYGANGAGKSSIFEALKVAFFYDKLSDGVESASTKEEQEEYNKEFWSKYNNSLRKEPFEVKINGSDFDDLDRASFSVFMLSIDDIKVSKSRVNFKDILSGLFYDCPTSLEELCSEESILIQEHVNECLSREFREDFQIEIDIQNDYDIRFIWDSKGISTILDCHKYFNEARINLVITLISLAVAELSSYDKDKSNIVVLDDIITSLDVVNRSHLLLYIFERFKESQVLFLTHNVNLFNLGQYLCNDILDEEQPYVYNSLYEYNGEHRLINNSELDSKAIRESLAEDPEAVVFIGNKIRQRFEVLLYKISHLLLIGAVEESKNIISRMERRKALYYNHGKNADDLVDEISRELRNKKNYLFKRRVQFRINNYAKKDYHPFLEVIKELKIFKKITLHPMSHGVIGRSTFTVKEIEFTLDLLDKFESYVKNLSNKKVDGM